MGVKNPQCDGEITAGGFHPLKFGVGQFFESPRIDLPKTKLKVDNQEIKLEVYERTFIFDR